MSLGTPTTKEVQQNIIAQLQAALNQTIPLFPKSFLGVLSKVLAGVFILLYKYGGFMFLQIFVKSATIDDTEVNGEIVSPLKFWGQLTGVGDPAPATNAELEIDITVLNQVGSLPSGSQLINSINGVTYITLGSVLLNAPVVQAQIKAVSDQTGGGGAGAIGNLSPGTTVAFANPLPNVAREAVVVSQTVTGADGESTEAYRQRILDRFQKRPQGGALADYELWAEEPAGVLNAYPYTSDCPGQVDVYIESATEADGIPTFAQLQEALDSINFDENGLASRRPGTALANTIPITRVPFDVFVQGLIVDNLGQVQADITAAVQEYFLDREPFLVGLTVLPRQDRITQSGVSGVVDDVVNAAGGIFSGVTVEQASVIIGQYTLGIGEKAKADLVSFT